MADKLRWRATRWPFGSGERLYILGAWHLSHPFPHSRLESFRRRPYLAPHIYASAAWARYDNNIPDPSFLLSEIEKVWCSEKLNPGAVSDPDRMSNGQ